MQKYNWTMQKCEECDGIGYLINPPDGADDCYECEGSGETMQEPAQ